jgi:hypothetical protein
MGDFGRHGYLTKPKRLADEPWSSMSLGASDALWARLDKYIASPDGFACDFPLRPIPSRGEALRVILDHWLAEREAER